MFDSGLDFSCTSSMFSESAAPVDVFRVFGPKALPLSQPVVVIRIIDLGVSGRPDRARLPVLKRTWRSQLEPALEGTPSSMVSQMAVQQKTVQISKRTYRKSNCTYTHLHLTITCIYTLTNLTHTLQTFFAHTHTSWPLMHF